MSFYQYYITDTLQAFALFIEQFLQDTRKVGKNFSESTNTLQIPIQFTALQWSLFKLLFILLFLTLLLIVYFWKVYGEVITCKFVRPSTLKEIEELKLSVAKLKLPKEHSPRI